MTDFEYYRKYDRVVKLASTPEEEEAYFQHARINAALTTAFNRIDVMRAELRRTMRKGGR